jgi:hypothetical protein
MKPRFNPLSIPRREKISSKTEPIKPQPPEKMPMNRGANGSKVTSSKREPVKDETPTLAVPKKNHEYPHRQRFANSPTPAAFADSARVFTGACDVGNFAEVNPPVGVFRFAFAFLAMIPSRLLANAMRSPCTCKPPIAPA